MLVCEYVINLSDTVHHLSHCLAKLQFEFVAVNLIMSNLATLWKRENREMERAAIMNRLNSLKTKNLATIWRSSWRKRGVTP